MKIIEQPRAPNPRRVRIFLAEKGIDVPFEAIDLNKQEHRAPAFTARNPLQQVPVLVLDDGMAISESVAICRYFEEMQPEPALFGRTPLQRTLVEMWQRRMEQGLLYPVGQCFRHTHPAMVAMEQPQIGEWAQINRGRALAMLNLLDGQLGEHRYVAGGDYSIADITAFVAVEFMKPARIDRPAELGHLDRWYREMVGRPSAKAGFS